MKNLVQTAIDTGYLKILVKVIREAGFVDILSDKGPFTIFAPTDKAFAKLPIDTLENIINDKEKLTEILTYHIISKKVIVNQIINLKKTNTVNGKDLSINAKKRFRVDNAKIIKKDIQCINGIIHIIDEVLIP
jgi:uncharacterized surface protein with fasciclin (FAS1) repeats